MAVGWCGDVWLRYGRCGVERSAGGCSVRCGVERSVGGCGVGYGGRALVEGRIFKEET